MTHRGSAFLHARRRTGSRFSASGPHISAAPTSSAGAWITSHFIYLRPSYFFDWLAAATARYHDWGPCRRCWRDVSHERCSHQELEDRRLEDCRLVDFREGLRRITSGGCCGSPMDGLLAHFLCIRLHGLTLRPPTRSPPRYIPGSSLALDIIPKQRSSAPHVQQSHHE
jgi:hypothetical protein